MGQMENENKISASYSSIQTLFHGSGAISHPSLLEPLRRGALTPSSPVREPGQRRRGCLVTPPPPTLMVPVRRGETGSGQGTLMTFPACPDPISDFTLNCSCDHLHNKWNKEQPALYIRVRVRIG